MIVAVVDVVNIHGQGRLFRLVAANRKQGGEYEFKRAQKTEKDLMADLSIGKYKIINADLDGDKIKGTAGDFSRFDNGVNKPLVILTEIVDHRGNTRGYRVSNFKGEVASMALKDVLNYCLKVHEKGGIPIQNGIYVPANGSQKAFIRSYPNAPFKKDIMARKNSQNVRPAKIDKVETEKNVNKLEELFNKEQIKELKLAKEHGVDVRIIGNNKLSAEQMRVIRECEEQGLPGRWFADPAYSLDTMLFLQVELMNGAEIRHLLNPKYSVGQMLELSVAYEQGLDTSEMDDPNLTVEEMAERRIRLASGLWRSHEVKEVETIA